MCKPHKRTGEEKIHHVVVADDQVRKTRRDTRWWETRLPWRVVPPGHCNSCGATLYGTGSAQHRYFRVNTLGSGYKVCACGGCFCSWSCEWAHLQVYGKPNWWLGDRRCQRAPLDRPVILGGAHVLHG
jgi:hypothetical protein